MIDIRDEEIIWFSREPYPIFRISSQKVLTQKYILKNNLNLEGEFDVKIKIRDYEKVVTNAIFETIDNHTVISKYV